MCHVSLGHIQTAIEAAGITTVSVTVRPDITRAVRVPRAAYVRFPLGNLFGEPGQPEVQRRILKEVLSIVETAEQAETVVEFPYRWRRLRFVAPTGD